jgi:hypothetical protein
MNAILDKMETLHKSDFVKQNAANHKLTNSPFGHSGIKINLTSFKEYIPGKKKINLTNFKEYIPSPKNTPPFCLKMTKGKKEYRKTREKLLPLKVSVGQG